MPKANAKRMKVNKENLVSLLKERLKEDEISDPNSNPNNKEDYLIDKEALISLFKKDGEYVDNVIRSAASSWSRWVPLETFINFIRYDAITTNQGKYTQGNYHMYMDYIHAMYDIKIGHIDESKEDKLGLPDYTSIKKCNLELYTQINPARMEFMFAWWIMNISRKYVSKYKYNIDISFQERICGKVYDIVIDPFDIVIEYQEARSNHTDSDNDVDKKAIVRAEAKVIEYFQEASYNKDSYEYLEYFWEEKLKRRINQFLIKDHKNNDFISNYLFEKFLDVIKHQKEQLQKNVSTSNNSENIKARIKQMNSLLSGDNEIIKKIFQWKNKERKAEREVKEELYIISSDDIAVLLKTDTSKSKKLIINKMKELVIDKKIKDKYYTNWNGLITFMIMVDTEELKVDNIVKRTVTDYLLITQQSYDKYVTDELNNYYQDMLRNILDDCKRREECIVEKIKAKHDRDITFLSEKNAEQYSQMKDLRKTVRMLQSREFKVLTELHTLSNNKTPTVKKPMDRLLKVMKEMSDISDKIDHYKEQREYELNDEFIINKPIINSIPDIIFTGSVRDKISIPRLKSFFTRYNIPTYVIKNIIEELCPYAKSPTAVFKIKLTEFDEDESDEEYVPNEEETKSEESEDDQSEDDKESDESDDELDI